MFHVGYTVDPSCRTQEPRESLYYAKTEFLFMKVGHGCMILGMETFQRLIFLSFCTLHFCVINIIIFNSVTITITLYIYNSII